MGQRSLRFVRTPALLVCEVEGPRVLLSLEKAGRSIELVALSEE